MFQYINSDISEHCIAKNKNQKISHRLRNYSIMLFSLAMVLVFAYVYVIVESKGFSNVLMDYGFVFVLLMLICFLCCIATGILMTIENKKVKKCTESLQEYKESIFYKMCKLIMAFIAAIGLVSIFIWLKQI